MGQAKTGRPVDTTTGATIVGPGGSSAGAGAATGLADGTRTAAGAGTEHSGTDTTRPVSEHSAATSSTDLAASDTLAAKRRGGGAEAVPKGRRTQFTWAVLPQGYKNRQTIFGNQLAKELEDWRRQQPEGVVLQYVDDILISAKSQDEFIQLTDDVTLKTTSTVNPIMFLSSTLTDSVPKHDYLQTIEEDYSSRPDLKDVPTK
ncbi:hypothetical protein BTVI_38063 [Pitangus sulphuratus]|nr:hypothetical protein BTVI_38063 [Pitangus sulphuratus]